MIYLDFSPEIEDFAKSVAKGLRQKPKRIPPKFFYDEKGSALFEEICRQPEYYPTRTETLILHSQIDAISQSIASDGQGGPATLIEFGSGASIKTRILLDHIGFNTYLPLDISKSFLFNTALKLQENYPRLRILPVFADFTRENRLPPFIFDQPQDRVVFVPGSTLGNFDPIDGIRILRSIRSLLETKGCGYLLIGMDLAKNQEVLEAAYNDAAGVTAEFNRNLIRRLNLEAGCDLAPEDFEHRAFYNVTLSRIEMHLVAKTALRFRIGHEEFRLEAGESIHTENSYKYRPSTFLTLCREAGFELSRLWTDPKEWFGVFLLKPRLDRKALPCEPPRISLESELQFG